GIKRYDEFKDAGYVFVGMEIPLFDGLQTKHSIAGARKAAEIARLRYRSALAQKRTRVEGLMRKLETATRRAELAGRRDLSSRSQQRHADLELQAQRGDLDSALTARRRSASDAAISIDRRFERIEVWARLQRETGRLVRRLAPDSGSTAPALRP
ncbi:MAG: TolC family protein, partial [Myxococcota bacterium]